MDKLEWIIHWISKNKNISEEELRAGLDSNYLESGWLDSFGFIELISAIEEELGKSFCESDFEDESFFTLKGLAEKVG